MRSANGTKLSIVIPVYNEEATVGQVIERVREVNLGSVEKEIIVANDGSSDGTWQVVRDCAERWPEVSVYTSPINLGKGAAVRLGMHHASGEIVIIQDADLELDPGEYPQIIGPILAGEADVVYGSRFMSDANHVPLRTRWANQALTTLTNVLFGGRLSDMETAYKAFRRDVLQGLGLRCARFDFEPEVTARLLLAGHRIHQVPISYHPRTAQDGKKISWFDGIEAVLTLLRCRIEARPT
jgi:glycosyltransferase involved in cell wall biosynthesis